MSDLDEEEYIATRKLHGLGLIRSDADKMFEELGYKNTNPNYMQIARYKKDDDNIIYFNKNKTFDKTGEYDWVCDSISMQELKAINKKCEELEWK